MGGFYWKELGLFLAFALATFLGYALFMSPPGTLCPSNAANCGREWISATSGWAAFLAGALSLVALFDQVKQQRLQTQFVLGEAPPTFDAYSEGFIDVYLRVVNWNRRTFLIEKIECSQANEIYVIDVRLEHKEEAETLVNQSPVFRYSIRVAAFDDRSKAPAICRIKLQVFGDSGVPTEMTFVLHGRLLGEEHREMTLRASATVTTVSALDGDY